MGGLFRPHRTPLKVNMGFGGCVCAIWSIELLYEVFRRILRSTMKEGSCTNCATYKGKKDSITCWSPYITFQSKNEYFKSPSDVRWSQRKAKWFFRFVFFSLSYVLFGQSFRSIELLLNFTYELLFQQSFCYITIKSESFSFDKMPLMSWTILTRVKFPSRIDLKVDIKFALSIYMYPV